MKHSPKVGIVIVNWNRKDDVLRAISSILKSDYRGYEILVVDNASIDGSVETIRAFNPEVEVISAEKNLGFTGGNNLGIRWMLDKNFDWLLLLNDDVALAPDAIRVLVEEGQNDPTIGMVGPVVYHATEPNVIQSAGGIIDKHWITAHRGQDQPDHGQYSQATDVQWITGCAILARVEMIRQVGLLDDRFFAYSEEVDWCLRAHKGGWKIRFVPNAHVWHSGVSTKYCPESYITYYMTRNHLLLLAKYQASTLVWVYSLFHTIRTLASWTIRPKWRYKTNHRDAMWRGIVDFLQHRWGPMPF